MSRKAAKETAVTGKTSRIKKTTTVIEENDDGDESESVAGLEAEQASNVVDEFADVDAAENMFEEIEDTNGVKINCYRMTGGRAMEFCFFVLADECDMGELTARIQTEHGPGRYQLVARTRQAILRRVVITIAKPLNPPQSHSQNGIGEMVANAINSALNPLIKIMEQQVAQPKPDPQAQMVQTLQLMQMMRNIIAPGQSTQPAQKTLAEQLKEMADTKNQLTALGLGGDGDGGSMMPMILSALAPAITKLMEQQTQQPRVNLQPRLKPAAAASELAPQTARIEQPIFALPEMTDPLAPLAPYIPQLLESAQTGADPEQVAVRFLSLVPDEAVDAIADVLESPLIIEQIQAAFPALNPYGDWLGKLAVAFLGGIEPDDSDAVESGESSDVPDPVP